MGKKIKIFLCDFVHNYLGAGSYMFPLNIGCIAAYTNKFFSDKVEIKLFKYPDKMLQAFNTEIPEIIGFSNYTWSADLNKKFAQFVKLKSPKTIVVFGGPNIDYAEKGVTEFFKTHSVDFYTPYQGETAFVNLLRRIIECGFDIAKIKNKPLDGIFFYDFEKDKAVIGKKLPRIKNPDEIPSPYLTGLLDEFFDYNLIPLIETNRGCPYQCTFCCQGLASYHQINFFSLERVKKELDYVAKHVKNTNLLTLADSNFGIVERDIGIAKYISELYKRTGYPRKVNSNIAKNQPKIYEIAKILNNINLIISLQSLDAEVLRRTKRSNIDLTVFRGIIDKINKAGGISGTEVILGLPGETKESHLSGLKTLFNWNVSYMICYNGLVLKSSEMSSEKEKGEFKCRTKFRLIDSSFGKYGEITSFEAEEGIIETDTMTEEELFSFRPVHWLIQFLWNYRFYYDLLKLIQCSGINPLDYILSLIEKKGNSTKKVKDIFKDFEMETKSEWFDSVEELQKHYSKPENFESLERGKYGKMNGKYIFRVLLEAKKDFEEHLYTSAVGYPGFSDKKETFREIIRFLSESIINLEDLWNEIPEEKFLEFKHNFIGWRESGYKKDLKDFYNPEGFRFRFYLTKEQKESLKKISKQYAHRNKNVALRKMSEHMAIRDFLYNVEIASKEKENLSYKETKVASNLKEIVIKDPYNLLVKKFGKWYDEYRKKWKEAGERKYVPQFPIHLDIDITDSCNLNCEYCLQRTHHSWSGINMDKKVFVKILDEAEKEGLCSINLGWNSEPILNTKHFITFLDVLDSYSGNMDVFLHTNAVNLTEEVQKRILNSKITTVCFSLGAVNDETRKKAIDRIKSNIINFRKLRDSLGKEIPVIRISMIPMESNLNELDRYIELWKQYADYIELQSMAFVENKEGKNFKKQQGICTDPWRRLTITSAGEIYPCCGFTCFSKVLKLGNVKDISLEDAWNSEKIHELRGQLKSNNFKYPGCVQCLSRLYRV